MSMNIFGKYFCPGCRSRIWSVFDNKYYEIFGICWECDKKRVEAKTLSLSEFEDREQKVHATLIIAENPNA